mmetsp:Transcript_92895/g.286759  ORF Transcript_92895/g.286759 Transcript_92895/m.286759 type:complete len:218 (-) Transcript_92895:14-667(-)
MSISTSMSSKPFCNSTSAYWIKPMSCRKATTGLFSWSPGAWRWSSCSFRRSFTTWNAGQPKSRMSASSMCISVSMSSKPLEKSCSVYCESPRARRKAATSDFPSAPSSSRSWLFGPPLTAMPGGGERLGRWPKPLVRALPPAAAAAAPPAASGLPGTSLIPSRGMPAGAAALPGPFAPGLQLARPNKRSETAPGAVTPGLLHMASELLLGYWEALWL